MSVAIDMTTDILHGIGVLDRFERQVRPLQKYGSLGFSGALHMGTLLVLAFCVFPPAAPGPSELTVVFAEDKEDVSDELLLEDDGAPYSPVEIEISVSIPQTGGNPTDLDVALFQPEEPDLEKPLSRIPAGSSPDTSSKRPVTKASLTVRSTSDAVDRVTDGIQGKLQSGDVLVVWLLDASRSMVDDRQRVAGRLKSFFRRAARRSNTPHQLLNAVVSFGATMNERVAPTPLHNTVVKSIRALPIDDSGKENIFTAVEQCVAAYGEKWQHSQLVIVLLTDESGDDVVKLESTIRVCVRQGFAVTVVGPSAVLGADTRMRSYRASPPHAIQPRPLTRGPDSALPERLQLGYWFVTRKPPTRFGKVRGFGKTRLPSWYGYNDQNVSGHRCIAGTDIVLPAWYGGHDLKGLDSGFSPYALTRLASQTGGTYIILDEDSEGGPFPADTMQAYLPDYGCLEDYLRDVDAHPLRRAVMQAVKLTQDENPGLPPTILFGQVSQSPPYGFMRAYFTPAKFAKVLTASRGRLKVLADRTGQVVEQALACVSDPGSVENGLEYDYSKETSRRWRAWYDLTRGRLLATSVRLEEYRLACDRMVQSGFLRPATNHLVLVPASRLASEYRYHRRAEEAETLLMRCVRENRNTPWAWLAQRELDYGLGLDIRQHTIGLVVMPSNPAGHPGRLPRL